MVFSIVLPLVFLERPYFFRGIGIAFMILLPTVHYFSYDIRKPHEYYFYFNLGLSKLVLWLMTVIVASVTGLVLILL